MKKNLLLSLIVIIPFFSQIYAQIGNGYHGYIDAGYSFTTGASLDGNWFEINTVHGYQATPHIFVGAGLGLHMVEKMSYGDISGRAFEKRDKSNELPIFADFRFTFMNKKNTPYLEARAGSYTSSGSGLYLNAIFGYRFTLNNNQAILLSASYESSEFSYQELNMSSNKYNISYYYVEKPKNSFSNIAIRLGYEF